MTNWLVNGSEAQNVAPDDRGIAYGDGLFETVAVRSGAYRFLDAHLARLAEGCARLQIAYPGDAVLLEDLQQLAKCAHGTLKIILTRGRGPRGYQPPPPGSASPTRIVGLEPTTEMALATPIRVRYCQLQLSRNPALAGIKTLNRLEHVMARAEWNDPEIQEGLLLNDRGDVVCGTMSNLFLVCGSQLLTPSLDECGVSGVMRAQLIRLAKANNIKVEEARVGKAEVAAADDILLTNSIIGVWPVNELDNRIYQRSDLTSRLLQLMAAAGVSECAQ